MDETLHISNAQESRPRKAEKAREKKGRGPQTSQRSPLRVMELVMNGVFFFCGIVAIVFVLFISIYLIVSGLPAIMEIGLVDFLFGQTWASTAKDPQFGILPFILTSIYGTAGAVVLGVPVGLMTAIFISKVAPKKVAAIVRPAVASEMSYAAVGSLQRQALFSIALVLFVFIMLINVVLNGLLKKKNKD